MEMKKIISEKTWESIKKEFKEGNRKIKELDKEIEKWRKIEERHYKARGKIIQHTISIEHILNTLIRNHFHVPTAYVPKFLGLLECMTLSSKIRYTYEYKLIKKEAYRELKKLIEIRNKLSHRHIIHASDVAGPYKEKKKKLKEMGMTEDSSWIVSKNKKEGLEKLEKEFYESHAKAWYELVKELIEIERAQESKKKK